MPDMLTKRLPLNGVFAAFVVEAIVADMSCWSPATTWQAECDSDCAMFIIASVE